MLNLKQKQTLMSLATMGMISISSYIVVDAYSLSPISNSGSSKQTIRQAKVVAYQVAAMYQQGLISSKFNQDTGQNLALRGPASVADVAEIAGKIGRDSWGREFQYRIEGSETGEFVVTVISEGSPGANAPIQTELSFYKE